MDDEFAKAVRELCQQHSQTEVAQRSGLDQSTISRIVHGGHIRGGTVQTARRLISAYPELRRFFVPENI